MAADKRTAAKDEVATLIEGGWDRGRRPSDRGTEQPGSTPGPHLGAPQEQAALRPETPGPVDPGDADLAPPDARYRLERLLGRGGMGEVALCFDQLLCRQVAVKSLRRRTAQADPVAAARFLREALVQGQLEHPAVVPVYDLMIGPGAAPRFTMKRIRGRTLQSTLDALHGGDAGVAAELPQRKLLSAFESACLAVSFAHSRGVIHRDLKPSNIMLGDFGEVYVLDWGLAKLARAADLPAPIARPGPPDEAGGAPSPLLSDGPQQTAAGVVLGTPGYMAPEQIYGDTEAIDERTDVYALGAILFEILTLKRLHEGEGAEALLTSTALGANARAHLRAPRSSCACRRGSCGRWCPSGRRHSAQMSSAISTSAPGTCSVGRRRRPRRSSRTSTQRDDRAMPSTNAAIVIEGSWDGALCAPPP